MSGRKRGRSPVAKRRRDEISVDNKQIDAKKDPKKSGGAKQDSKQRVFKSRQRTALDDLQGRVAQMREDNADLRAQLDAEQMDQNKMSQDLQRMRTFMSQALTFAWTAPQQQQVQQQQQQPQQQQQQQEQQRQFDLLQDAALGEFQYVDTSDPRALETAIRAGAVVVQKRPGNGSNSS